jgi:hypothetical protein
VTVDTPAGACRCGLLVQSRVLAIGLELTWGGVGLGFREMELGPRATICEIPAAHTDVKGNFLAQRHDVLEQRLSEPALPNLSAA